MSKPQNSRNLITPADRKSAKLTHKFTATKGSEFKATNPVPPFLQQVAPALPEGAVESKQGHCEGWQNAHWGKPDPVDGTVFRPRGESKFLCAECLELRCKALDSQNYPSADRAAQLEAAYGKPRTVAAQEPPKAQNKIALSKRPTDKQIIDGGGSITYRGYALRVGEFDGRTGYYGKHANGIDAVGPFWNLTACKRAADQDISGEDQTLASIRLLNPVERMALRLIADCARDGKCAYLNFGEMPRADRDLGILRPVPRRIAENLMRWGLVEAEHDVPSLNPNLRLTESAYKALEGLKS